MMASTRSRKASSSSASVTLNTSVRPINNQNYTECMRVLSQVFNEVQSDDYIQSHQKEKLQNKLLKQVFAIYTKVGKIVFAQTLMRLMIVPFQNRDSNPFVVRIIEFFYTLITWERWKEDAPVIGSDESNCSIASTNTTTTNMDTTLGENDSSEILPLLILKQCEKYSNERRLLVRQRLLQTVSKIIPEVVTAHELKKSLRQRLLRMLVLRSKDKCDAVRALSVKILSCFVGDNLPFQAEVNDVIMDRMAFDPSPTVRAEAVACVKITDEIVDHVVERAGDPVPMVRTAALNKITSSIGLYSLTVEMREAILEFNASRDNPKDVQNAMHSLLRNWLECLNGDPTELLRVLNARKRVKLCRKTLDLLFDQPPEEAFEKISQPVLKGNKFPEDSLCIEITFLWLYMHQRFCNEPYIMKKLTLSVEDMIEYIMEYVEVIEDENELSDYDLEYRSWMLGDLLNILCYLPNEEGERVAIMNFLPKLYATKKLMDARNSSLAIKIIKVCSDIKEETHLINLVNSILDSDRRRSKPTFVEDSKMEVETDPDDKHLKLEMAHLRHQTKQLEQSRDLAVRVGDLRKAQECQDEINKKEIDIEKLKKRINALNESIVTTAVNDPQEEREEGWVFSDETMLTTICMVKTNILHIGSISSFSQTFYEMYVTKAVVKCAQPHVRAQALELMCVVALKVESECPKAATYCLVGLKRDREVVKITALKCLYDLVLRYSFAQLGDYSEVQEVLMGHVERQLDESNSNVKRGRENPASLLKSFLLSYVNDDNQKLVKVSVAGILKLLFRKELSNTSRLIVDLVMKWGLPLHETKVRFKDVAVMIPMYATIGEKEVIEIAKCLITCVRKTIKEIHSKVEGKDGLPHPEISDMITLIVNATEPSRLADFDIQRPYIGHETIAEGALTELAKIDLSNEEGNHYAKLLKLLDLRQCPVESLNRMKHTVNEITEFSKRQVSIVMAGFSTYLDSLMEGNDAIPDVGRSDGITEGAFEEDE